MKPTSLKPGDRVQFRDSSRVVEFVRRDPSECARPAHCWFRDPNGDLCATTDADVIRRCDHVQQEPRPRG